MFYPQVFYQRLRFGKNFGAPFALFVHKHFSRVYNLSLK